MFGFVVFIILILCGLINVFKISGRFFYNYKTKRDDNHGVYYDASHMTRDLKTGRHVDIDTYDGNEFKIYSINHIENLTIRKNKQEAINKGETAYELACGDHTFSYFQIYWKMKKEDEIQDGIYRDFKTGKLLSICRIMHHDFREMGCVSAYVDKLNGDILRPSDRQIDRWKEEARILHKNENEYLSKKLCVFADFLNKNTIHPYVGTDFSSDKPRWIYDDNILGTKRYIEDQDLLVVSDIDDITGYPTFTNVTVPVSDRAMNYINSRRKRYVWQNV